MLPKYLEEQKKQFFHLRHEMMTHLLYRVPRMLPDRYVFVLTNLCNLKCSFCFQQKDLRPDRMTLENWINVVNQLPAYARVTLTGGEPLMFPEFRKIFAYIAARFDCNMISNGLLLNEETTDFLLSFPRFKVLSVSIDDFKNKVRGVTERQWERCEGLLNYFVRKREEFNSRCVFEVKCVVLDENAEYLFDLYRFAVEKLRCDHFSFQFLKGSAIQHADYMFPFEAMLKKSSAPVYTKFETIKQQLTMIRDYNLREHRKVFLHPKVADLNTDQPLPDLDFLNEREHIKTNFYPCKFPWSSVHINVDGQLFPCMAIAMGNVKEQFLMDIVQGKEFTRFKDLIRREGTVEGCNRCGWLRPAADAVSGCGRKDLVSVKL